MNLRTAALLQLVRAGIYDDATALEDFPRLSVDDWNYVYDESKRQTVSGVALHGLSLLPGDSMPHYPLLVRWVARGHRIESAHQAMSATVISLLARFSGAGLHPVLQKGHAVARFYPQPELRVCGDIDLWFPATERRQADTLASSGGNRIRHGADASSLYHCDGLEVEHHSTLVELHNPFFSRRLASLLNQEGYASASIAQGAEARVPAPLVELVMINVHIMKHCFGVGIGLRHFCDYAMAYRSLLPLIGYDRYMETCRSLGIARWTGVLHRFIALYLPAPTGCGRSVADTDTKYDATARRIFRMVMDGGNFGLFRRGRDKVATLPTWRRKLSTLSLFLNHSTTSMRLSPSEAFWTFARLLSGQIN